jgi:hypothetical protein
MHIHKQLRRHTLMHTYVEVSTDIYPAVTMIHTKNKKLKKSAKTRVMMYVCTCIRICIYVYIYIYICLYVHEDRQTHVCPWIITPSLVKRNIRHKHVKYKYKIKYMRMHPCICTHVCINTYTYVYTCVHA